MVTNQYLIIFNCSASVVCTLYIHTVLMYCLVHIHVTMMLLCSDMVLLCSDMVLLCSDMVLLFSDMVLLCSDMVLLVCVTAELNLSVLSW